MTLPKKNKPGAGRPFKKLDENEIYKLAQLWCTMEEIAAHFDVSVDTIERNYAEVVKKGKEDGKASLRRMQWRSALEGNVAMQIWLGKTILKQREDIAVDNNITFERIERPYSVKEIPFENSNTTQV